MQHADQKSRQEKPQRAGLPCPVQDAPHIQHLAQDEPAFDESPRPNKEWCMLMIMNWAKTYKVGLGYMEDKKDVGRGIWAAAMYSSGGYKQQQYIYIAVLHSSRFQVVVMCGSSLYVVILSCSDMQ